MTDVVSEALRQHPHLPLLVLAISLLFVGTAAVEGWYLQRVKRRAYDWGAFLASLGVALGRQLVDRLLGFGLAGALFAFAARYRIADIACYPYVALAPEGGIELAPYPAVSAWLKRIRALPGHVGMPGI